MLQIGTELPDITLENQDGEEISLRSFIGKPIVIFFYPKDNTRVCTAQACSFRDRYEDFLEIGADVVGISHDSAASHKNVQTRHKLPFNLLSDPKRKALKAFKVPSYLFGLLSARVTFIIDSTGKIIYHFRADLKAEIHIQKSLEILRSI